MKVYFLKEGQIDKKNEHTKYVDIKKIKVWYVRNNINIPKLPVYIRFPGMSEYISTYQVHRHTCRHKNQRNKYVYITMKYQYVYEHTKYANLFISIPSMSK